jgi:NAD(P)H dehydrogenase (quinone)
MSGRIQVIFYSMYGHVYRMAEAVAAGAREAGAREVGLWQVPELVPDKILEKSGAAAARAAFAHVPVAKPTQLAEADAIVFGTPTRFGNMAGQMRNFLDQTGGLWADGALVGKVGSVFASTASQHGGHEMTLVSFHTTLLHHGMIVVGLPYTEQRLTNMAEITGGALWRHDFGRNRRLTPAERERARHRPLSGQTCGTDHQRPDRRPQNNEVSPGSFRATGLDKSPTRRDRVVAARVQGSPAIQYKRCRPMPISGVSSSKPRGARPGSLTPRGSRR